MKNFKDQLNRTIQLKEAPKRIVSLVPSQTELLVDLGLENAIVGVTKFCVHPKNLRKEKTIVGGTKNIKVEKIKALQPDIILCNKEENSFEIIDALKGVAPIHISDIYTLDDAFQMIRMYGVLFGVQQKAQSIISVIKKERNAFHIKVKDRPKPKAAYFIWKTPWMVAASNTFVHTMLREAGFINIFSKEKRYPEISLSHPKLKEADVLILSSEPFPFKSRHIEDLMKIFPKKQIIIVDGEQFSWYGSRLEKSYIYFNKISLL